MAVDLASLPSTGIRVQCCGDAQLVNFRGFGTPERRVQFDIHDLDETLPASWEWDVKRLAASFVLASRENGLGDVCGADCGDPRYSASRNNPPEPLFGASPWCGFKRTRGVRVIGEYQPAAPMQQIFKPG